MKNKLIFGFLLFAITAFSQINSNVKAITFANADSASVKSMVSALQTYYGNIGALYYNKQSSKFRIFYDSAWWDLVQDTTGGSGSALYFKNGLTKLADSTTVVLGGSLNRTTSLTGANRFNAGTVANNIGSFRVNADTIFSVVTDVTGGGTGITLQSGSVLSLTAANTINVAASASGSIIIDSGADNILISSSGTGGINSTGNASLISTSNSAVLGGNGSENSLRFNSVGNTVFNLTAFQSTLTADGDPFNISGVTPVSTNQNGGDVNIVSGAGTGTGLGGDINIDSNLGSIYMGNNSSVDLISGTSQRISLNAQSGDLDLLADGYINIDANPDVNITGSSNVIVNAPSTFINSQELYLTTASSSLDFPSTLAGTSADLTITFTGAVSGDMLLLGVPNSSIDANSCFTAWVSAANTVTVRFNNYSAIPIDPASGTFKVTAIK